MHVMHVRHMRMLVPHPSVPVRIGVWLAGQVLMLNARALQGAAGVTIVAIALWTSVRLLAA
jgi:hypothetical protein